MNIKELAEQAGMSNTLGCFWQCGDHDLKRFAELVAAAERNRCISIIENYQIHVGASTAGEIACAMTYSALRDIRDEIKERINVDAIDTSSSYVDENEKREHEPVQYAAPPNTSGYAKKIESLIKERDVLRQQLAQPEHEHWNTSDMAYRPSGLSMEQEPVAWMHVQGDYKEVNMYELDEDALMRGWEQYPLYAAPPIKEFVPLSIKELDNIVFECGLSATWQDIAIAIASALKEKNNE